MNYGFGAIRKKAKAKRPTGQKLGLNTSSFGSNNAYKKWLAHGQKMLGKK